MNRISAARQLAAALAAVALIDGSAQAQSLSGSDLKAAYLINFARFVEWPVEVLAAGAPLAICVDNDDAVANAVERTIKGRAVGDHQLTVKRLTPGALLPKCDVLYVGGSDPKRAAGVIVTIKDTGVFTVSDASRFAQTGGIAELFLEDGRIRIAVNVDALRRAGIRLSSRVLGLAKIVRDAPGL